MYRFGVDPKAADASVTPAAGPAQEEGRRIVELLLRFDPIRLRSECGRLGTLAIVE